MINYLETFINETQVFKSLDSPDHYWLAACSPDWLWSLGSYTWFHSLANWRPPPEMGQKIKRASFWRVLTLNVSLQPARMRMLWHLKQLGSQSWCVCVCVCVCAPHLCPLLSELLLLKSPLLSFLLQFLHLLHTVGFPPCWKDGAKIIEIIVTHNHIN